MCHQRLVRPYVHTALCFHVHVESHFVVVRLVRRCHRHPGRRWAWRSCQTYLQSRTSGCWPPRRTTRQMNGRLHDASLSNVTVKDPLKENRDFNGGTPSSQASDSGTLQWRARSILSFKPGGWPHKGILYSMMDAASGTWCHKARESTHPTSKSHRKLSYSIGTRVVIALFPFR